MLANLKRTMCVTCGSKPSIGYARRVGSAGIPWHMKREMCVKSR